MNTDIRKVNLTENTNILFDLDNSVDNKSCYLPARSIKEQEYYLKDSNIYLAYADNQPVGFLAFKEDGEKIDVQAIVVTPTFQGKGVGKELMNTLLKVNEGKELRLVTHPYNTKAIIFYLKSGFQIEGWADNYYGDGQPRLVLVRK